MFRSLRLAVFACVPLASFVACGDSVVLGQRPAPGIESFVSPDAGDVVVQPPGTVLMCPVTTCSPPRTTCPSSRFLCDVDLLHDNDNCGECGNRCSDGSSSVVNWTCVGGKCAFGCGQINSADCDGDPTNGCEVSTFTDKDNCGGCGIKCPDGFTCSNGECVNGCLQANKPDKCSGVCTNLAFDDRNCGTCADACDPTGPNLPPVAADMYYGCGGAECGKLKCAVPNAADCNQNPSDGCEATLHTNEHCNACGDACSAGKQCLRVTGNVFACLCEDDAETFCGPFFAPFCRRLDDDPLNCGGCDRVCPGAFIRHFSATCTHGICGGGCADGHADCDGFNDNGCEVETLVDNHNCGACGHPCLPNQVCSEGKCLMAPCDAGAPEDPTK